MKHLLQRASDGVVAALMRASCKHIVEFWTMRLITLSL